MQRPEGEYRGSRGRPRPTQPGGVVLKLHRRRARRAYSLTLTAAGREVLSEAETLIDKVEGALLAPLDDAERRHIHRLLLSLLPGMTR
jgi:DNA-binding MarR family transcriptional regulator